MFAYIMSYFIFAKISPPASNKQDLMVRKACAPWWRERFYICKHRNCIKYLYFIPWLVTTSPPPSHHHEFQLGQTTYQWHSPTKTSGLLRPLYSAAGASSQFQVITDTSGHKGSKIQDFWRQSDSSEQIGSTNKHLGVESRQSAKYLYFSYTLYTLWWWS